MTKSLKGKILKIFKFLLYRIPGTQKTYTSMDSIKENVDGLLYPVEFINTLNPSDIPPHELKLKVGCIVMLMRNLCVKEGLCNGTRLLVKEMHPNVIKTQILTGKIKFPFFGIIHDYF